MELEGTDNINNGSTPAAVFAWHIYVNRKNVDDWWPNGEEYAMYR